MIQLEPMRQPNQLFARLGCSLALLIFTLAPFLAMAQSLTPISRNLKLGDSGEDVLSLQRILNLDPQTSVSSVGPGSPGMETRFFGFLTHAAVVRFQEKYAAEVLAPVGLARGSGFVGPLTRGKMAMFHFSGLSQSTTVVPSLPTPSFAPTPVSVQPPAPTPPSNPNLVNLESFIEKVAQIQRDNNADEALIDKITSHIRSEAMTKGDFREEFARREIEANKRKLQDQSAWRNILIASFKSVNPFVKIAHAQALAFFGGPINFVFPCLCSGTSLVEVGPPSVSVLDYIYGTQAFLSYNLPYAAFILGSYQPGVGGSCVAGVPPSCTLVNSQGIVSPVVGSSA